MQVVEGAAGLEPEEEVLTRVAGVSVAGVLVAGMVAEGEVELEAGVGGKGWRPRGHEGRCQNNSRGSQARWCIHSQGQGRCAGLQEYGARYKGITQQAVV